MSLKKIFHALTDPGRVRYEIRRQFLKINSLYFDVTSDEEPLAIMSEDWDNLVILDGCRYDIFENRCNIPGELKSQISLGSESWEFLENNFSGKQFHDTVYVTANPHAPKLPNDTFHAVINLLNGSWDPEYKTVHPSDMFSKAKSLLDQMPNKRFIFHFMQPHFPFIGETGMQLRHKGLNGDDDDAHVWASLMKGEFDGDEEQVITAYQENLDVVLPYIRELLDDLTGKTVITADHGNLIGEPSSPIPVKGYGHPRGIHIPELVKVPWLVIEDGERPTITKERPENTDRLNQDTINQRLKDLGYK